MNTEEFNKLWKILTGNDAFSLDAINKIGEEYNQIVRSKGDEEYTEMVNFTSGCLSTFKARYIPALYAEMDVNDKFIIEGEDERGWMYQVVLKYDTVDFYSKGFYIHNVDYHSFGVDTRTNDIYIWVGKNKLSLVLDYVSNIIIL